MRQLIGVFVRSLFIGCIVFCIIMLGLTVNKIFTLDKCIEAVVSQKVTNELCK